MAPPAQDLVQKVVSEAVLESKIDAEVQQTTTDRMLVKAMKGVAIHSRRSKPSRASPHSSSSSGSTSSSTPPRRRSPRRTTGPVLDASQLSPSPEPKFQCVPRATEESEQIGSASGPFRRAVSPAHVAACGDVGPSGKECRHRSRSRSVEVSREVRAGRRRPSMGPRASHSELRADRPLRYAPWIPLVRTEPRCPVDSHRCRPGHPQPLEGPLQREHKDLLRLVPSRREASHGGAKPPLSAPPRVAQPVQGPARDTRPGPKTAKKRAHSPSFWSGAVPGPPPFSVWPLSPDEPKGPPAQEVASGPQVVRLDAQSGARADRGPDLLFARRNSRLGVGGALGGPAPPHDDVFRVLGQHHGCPASERRSELGPSLSSESIQPPLNHRFQPPRRPRIRLGASWRTP